MTANAKPHIDFTELAPFIDADTFAAMQRVTSDPKSCGLNINRPEDEYAIAQLKALREATGVCFIRNDRGDGWIEVNGYGRAYIHWREWAERMAGV